MLFYELKCWLNSETLIEEVPLLSTCATAAAAAMVSKYQFEFAAKNSDFFGIFGAKFKLTRASYSSSLVELC